MATALAGVTCARKCARSCPRRHRNTGALERIEAIRQNFRRPGLTMTKRSRKHPIRSIRTKRDFEGAAAVVKRLADHSERDAAAELRLNLLLKELDEFDAPAEDADLDPAADDDYPGPRRRWSDDAAEDS